MIGSPTAFGRLLRAWRKREGLTLRELAERVPFSYSHLSRMESGDRNPPARRGVIQLAQATGGQIDELLSVAGYAAEGAGYQGVPQMSLEEACFTVARHQPTADELRVIDEANAEQVYFAAVTEPDFWQEAPEERRAVLRYLEGLTEEARRFHKRQGRR